MFISRCNIDISVKNMELLIKIHILVTLVIDLSYRSENAKMN